MARRTFLIDCDTGIDDAVALLMALRSPEVDVAGISVVAGNVPVDVALDNTLRVVELAGVDRPPPVARGAEQALVEPWRAAAHVHGEGGLGQYELPPPRLRPDPRPAAVMLVELIRGAAEPVTLVALAPLTNLALALRLAPDIGARTERLVVMGGSGDSTGNATAAAEFNVAVDPEAAWIVFHAGLPITMVGLDPCRLTSIPVERAAGWLAGPNPRLHFLGGILDHYGAALARRSAPLYDAVAMTVALRPELARIERRPAEIELARGHHCGAVLVDRRHEGLHHPEWPRVDVVWEVDGAAHERLLLELLR